MPRGRSDRIALIERLVTERLSAPGIDLLFDGAEVLSEGNGPALEPGATFYGSTMLTIALDTLAPSLDEPVTPAAMELLHRLCAADQRVRRRLVELARREVIRQCAGRDLDACDVDVALRVEGLRLLVDLDVTATVAAAEPGDRAA